MMPTKVTQALIYAELINIKKTIEQHTHTDNENFQELRRLMEGSDTAPGMKVRVDRLEQADTSRKRHFGYLWSAIVVLLAAAVRALWSTG